MKFLIATLLFAMFGFLNTAEVSSVSQTAISVQEVQEHGYKFIATKIIPLNLPSKSLVGDNYTIFLSEEEVVSDLPYRGVRRQGIQMGKDKGNRFEGKPTSYSVTKSEKETRVEATVESENDVFEITLTFSDSGYATLIINSRNKETVTYLGEMLN